MREILFKAKRTDNGEWADGCYIFDERNGKKHYIGYVLCSDAGQQYGADIVEVVLSTLCQYTGLTDGTSWGELSEKEQQQFLAEWNYERNRKNKMKDWNGKKIWENDILRHDNGNYMIVRWNGKCARWDLVLNSKTGLRYPVGEWRPLMIDWKTSEWKLHTSNRDYEVVGNVFDNPELIGNIKLLKAGDTV